MKQILRIGERYALSKKYISLAAVLIIMCLFAVKQASAKVAEPAATAVANANPLQIGDTIPEYLWHLPLQVVNHPEGKGTVTLKDYQGKLIILDFWATWCGACIAAMPRINELKKKFGEMLVILPVTYESVERAKFFLETNNVTRNLGLFSVVEGDVLKTTFPHRGIPHYVWINREGKVMSTTNATQVSAQNIRSVLNKEDAAMPLKVDIDPDRPLFLGPHLEIDGLTHFSILTRSSYDGLPYGTRFRKEGEVVRGRAFTNSTIRSMYEAAARYLFERGGEKYAEKRAIIEISDRSTFELTKSPTGDGSFINDYIYNYELIVPEEKADSLYDYMLADLNRYTGFDGRIEKRRVKCFVLSKIGDLERIGSGGGKPENSLFFGRPPRLVNAPIEYLVHRLNGLREIPLPVINETGHVGNIDLEFSGGRDLQSLQAALRRYNLELVEQYRTLDMLVITDGSNL